MQRFKNTRFTREGQSMMSNRLSSAQKGSNREKLPLIPVAAMIRTYHVSKCLGKEFQCILYHLQQHGTDCIVIYVQKDDNSTQVPQKAGHLKSLSITATLPFMCINMVTERWERADAVTTAVSFCANHIYCFWRPTTAYIKSMGIFFGRMSYLIPIFTDTFHF